MDELCWMGICAEQLWWCIGFQYWYCTYRIQVYTGTSIHVLEFCIRMRMLRVIN